MSKLSRENTALKMKGAGDGIKNITRSSERIPVPSSRKFTATLHRDESVQLKLKKVLDDLEAKQGKLKKAKTVAEITPTKSIRKKPVKRQDGGASSALHATPRPPSDAAKGPPSGREDGAERRRRQLELLVYHRMLVFVWRRSRARLTMLSESLRRRQDQINNLDKQVNCLKHLTHAECLKRGEATNEYQRMENILQTVRMENTTLTTEKTQLQSELDDLRNKLQKTSTELENIKNEINTKNMYIKRLENEVQKERITIMKIREDNSALVDKMKAQDVEIESQEKVADKLNQALKDSEKRLKERETGEKEHVAELNRLREQYKIKVKSCDCLRQELSRVCSLKDEMKQKIDNLEDKLAALSGNYEAIFEENTDLKVKVEKSMWKNVKELVQVSWVVLQNAAYLMLPAL